MDTSEQAILVETPKREARRRRSVEEKRRIVEETLEAGASVARVARRHAVNANQVFYWRKKYREGRLGKGQSSKLLPVTLSDISWSKSGRAIMLRNERCGSWLWAERTFFLRAPMAVEKVPRRFTVCSVRPN